MAVNNCVKYLLFFFNLLFWISGCIILGVSIYVKVTKDTLGIPMDSLPGVDLMIAIGVIIMVLGFLGCCGAIRESRCLLLLFFIGLLLIFILLLAAGIVGAVGESKVQEWVKDRLEEKFSPLSSKPESVQQDFEKLQRELKCCGLKGPSDWTKIPDSCRCNTTEPDCPSSKIYQSNCIDKTAEWMKSNLEVVLGVAFGIAILLIFGMVMAMMLYCQIGRKDGATTA
ncbi:unnamed protein product [Tetraodon nigroviridis]|nr:unnamed protein product [Tetraodon nigroviridis]